MLAHKEPVVVTYIPYGSLAATLCNLLYLALVFLLPVVLIATLGDIVVPHAVLVAQPQVLYTDRLLLHLAVPDSPPLIWASEPSVAELLASSVSPVVRTRLEDATGDSKADMMRLQISIPLPEGSAQPQGGWVVVAINTTLKERVSLSGQSLLFFSLNGNGIPGGSATLRAQLRLHQRKAISSATISSPPFLTNLQVSSLTPEALHTFFDQDVFFTADILDSTWKQDPTATQFDVNIHISISPQHILYNHSFWEHLQFSLVQYVALVVLFHFFASYIKSFLFVRGVLASRMIKPDRRLL